MSQSTRCCWQSKDGRISLPATRFVTGSRSECASGSGPACSVTTRKRGQRPPKSNRDTFLSDSERTGVTSENVRSGYHVAQRILEREVVGEKSTISDATVFQHMGGHPLCSALLKLPNDFLGKCSVELPGPPRPSKLIPAPSSPVDDFPSPGHIQPIKSRRPFL